MNATKHHIGKNKNSRRKKTKATASTVERIFAMDETGKRHLRNPKRPTPFSSDRTASNGFLKTTFLPKLKENETLTTQKDCRKTVKTERDFYQSLSRLTGHYGIIPKPMQDFEYPYNIALSLWDTEKQMEDKIENCDQIRLVQNKDNTYFISEERYNTGTSLFYIPVIPLYKMLKDKNRKKTAQMLLSVCCYLYRNVDIPYYRLEDSYLYLNYEMLNDWIDEDLELDAYHIYKKELQQAEIIGDVMGQKISHRKNSEVFGKRIERFRPKDDFDEECFRLSETAFQLYTDYPEESIFRNIHFNNTLIQENTNEDDYYNEDKVISMDRYVSFFANDRGLIYQNLIDSVNNEFNEYGGVQEPIIFKTFDGSEITNKNLDFESRLFKLLCQLAGLLSEYSRIKTQ